MSVVAPKPALRVTGLHKAYQDVVAVNGLDLEVRAGECFGLLGPNGAGKTTTVEICEGLTAPDSGEVELLGMHWNTDADQLRQRLGIQLQDTQLSEKLTVFETLRLFRSFFDQGPGAAEAIALVQLEEKKNSRVGNLSGGQKQRLALACALVGDPDFLFLDEPTTGLDPQARRQLWDLIEQFKSSGRTILLTTHYMDEAERLCERVAIMDNGKQIALGSPRELIASTCAEHMVAFSAGAKSNVARYFRIAPNRRSPRSSLRKWHRRNASHRIASRCPRTARGINPPKYSTHRIEHAFRDIRGCVRLPDRTPPPR